MIFNLGQIDLKGIKELSCQQRVIPILLLTVLFFGFVTPGLSKESAPELQEEIQERKKRVQEERQDLERLTRQEREAYQDLAQVEERVQELNTRLEQQEDKLARSEEKEQKLREEHERLEQRVQQARQELETLLQDYWPLLMRAQSFDPGQYSSMQKARRDMTWMNEIYALVQEKSKDLAREQQSVEQSLAEQQNLRQEMAAQVQEIRSTQNELLQKRMSFMRRVQEIRARKLAKEEQLQEIQDTVDQMQRKVDMLDVRDIEELKGHLPWPAEGEKIQGFKQDGSSPDQGLGLALREGQEVNAVFWGTVVFNDELRGYGQVIILFHGEDYYTLYAFLSSTQVRVGQEVEKGKPLGRAGYYPQSEGPGLYFELRMGQKPVNPEPWLSSVS